MSIKEPQTEKEWKARDDARILARAEEIKSDKSRYNTAVGAAKIMLEDEKDELRFLSKVVRKQADNTISQNNNRKKNKSKPDQSGLNVFRRI